MRALIIFALIKVIACENVLILNGIASPSHHLWNRVLAKGLAKEGFNVTMVSVDEDKNPPQPNIHYIFLEATYRILYSEGAGASLLEMADQSPVKAVLGAYDWCDKCCDGVLASEGLDVILNYPNDFKFDAVIHDFNCAPCLLPLIHKFNYPPLISATAFSNPPFSHHLIGGQKYPAYVPHYLLDYPQLMSFPQRFFNTFIYVFDSIMREHVTMPKMESKIRKRFNFKDFPSINKLEKMTSLMLINTENAFDFPEPLQPNMIQVAGLQITEPKELPEKISTFIESGKRGTVLMSLGTNMKSNMLGNATLTSIIETFAAIKDFNFIWKFESEPHELPVKLSKNVYIAKFLPQNDILAHPKIVAFITHSGLLSTQESLWYGKPMIAIPFIVDQKRTAHRSAQIGVGVEFDFRTWNVETFKEAILSVLENQNLTENAQKVSKLFRDKPQKPLELAVWWIKYVIRNPSAPQFQSPTLKLGSFASNSYDVILAVLLIIYAAIYLVLKIITCLRNAVGKSINSEKLKRS